MRALFGNLIFIIYAIGFLIIWGSKLIRFNIDNYTPEKYDYVILCAYNLLSVIIIYVSTYYHIIYMHPLYIIAEFMLVVVLLIYTIYPFFLRCFRK